MCQINPTKYFSGWVAILSALLTSNDSDTMRNYNLCRRKALCQIEPDWSRLSLGPWCSLSFLEHASSRTDRFRTVFGNGHLHFLFESSHLSASAVRYDKSAVQMQFVPRFVPHNGGIRSKHKVSSHSSLI